MTATDARVWTDGSETHIDVRGLARPQPLIQILQLLQRLRADAVVIVHHDRDPVWLYPELVQSGWWGDVIDGEPGEVRLRITKNGPTP